MHSRILFPQMFLCLCKRGVSWKETQETGSAGFLQESELLNVGKGSEVYLLLCYI